LNVDGRKRIVRRFETLPQRSERLEQVALMYLEEVVGAQLERVT